MSVGGGGGGGITVGSFYGFLSDLFSVLYFVSFVSLFCNWGYFLLSSSMLISSDVGWDFDSFLSGSIFYSIIVSA